MFTQSNEEATSTFATNAPAYWAAGFSVVPITNGTKLPAIAKWSGYCDNLPGDQKREAWLSDFPSHGIGLLMGTQIATGFRIIAIDIDDDCLVRPVCALLDDRCAKIGRKGHHYLR